MKVAKGQKIKQPKISEKLVENILMLPKPKI